MKTLFRLVMLVLTLGGWALAAASVYVIRSPEKITIIPRNRVEFLGIPQVYVDTRAWQLDDVAKHSAVVARMISCGKASLLQHLAPQMGEKELTQRLEDDVRKSAQDSNQPSSSTGIIINQIKQTRSSSKPHLQGKTGAKTQPDANRPAADQPQPDSAGPGWLKLALSLDF